MLSLPHEKAPKRIRAWGLFFTALLLASASGAADFDSSAYTIIARRRPKQFSESRLTSEESRDVAGASGDVMRAVAALPGASTANDYLANLMVRGGGMEDNLILFDGFPVSYPFHFGGVESVFHPGLIAAADFLPSGFDVRYGDAQGGVLELHSKHPEPGLHGEAGLSMINAGALLSYAKEDGPAISADYRRGYFDLVLDKNITDTGVPRYQDYATKLWWGDFGLTVFGSQDELNVNSATSHSSWESDFNTLGLSYEPHWGPWWLSAKAGASLARAAVDLGPDLNLDRRPYEWLASVETGASPGSDHELDFGAQWRQTRTMLSGTFKRLPVELGTGFDFNAAQTVSVDALGSKSVVSLWAQDRWQVVDRLWVNLGARYDHVDLADEFHISPRASAEYKPFEKTTIKATLGDYFQSPNGMETVPGWTLGYTRSSLTHLYSGAVEQGLGKKIELRLEAYHKDFERRIPPIVVGNQIGSVAINAANVGFSEGAEASLRLKASGGTFGWLSYAWNDTMRSSGQGFYDADFSQPHVINAVLNQTFGDFEIGGRYRLASGIPYTPVESRSYDSAQGRWIPVFGATNSQRLDWYQRLDLRGQYSWTWSQAQLRLFLELYNALDWPNVTSVTYQDDYSGIRTVKQFPRFLFAGIELEF